jgi:hypothetical protein
MAEHWTERERRAYAEAEAKMLQDARDALAEMLGRWQWEWFVTLTFRGSPRLGYCYSAWADLIRWLRQRGGEPQYFRGTEWQMRGTPHFHALVFGVNHAARRMDVVDWWGCRYGWARVFAYDPRLGAGFYVTKYLCKDYRDTGNWALEIGGQKILDFPEPVCYTLP